jgi:hypothetical protein
MGALRSRVGKYAWMRHDRIVCGPPPQADKPPAADASSFEYASIPGAVALPEDRLAPAMLEDPVAQEVPVHQPRGLSARAAGLSVAIGEVFVIPPPAVETRALASPGVSAAAVLPGRSALLRAAAEAATQKVQHAEAAQGRGVTRDSSSSSSSSGGIDSRRTPVAGADVDPLLPVVPVPARKVLVIPANGGAAGAVQTLAPYPSALPMTPATSREGQFPPTPVVFHMGQPRRDGTGHGLDGRSAA